MRDIGEVARECYEIAHSLGIPVAADAPVRYNGRIRNKWGYCRIRDGSFEISVAKVLGEEDTPKKAIMATVLHEMLHTCPGCFNHGKRWKAYAKEIRKAYGIKIRESADAEDMGTPLRYYIKCRRCGQKVRYAMKPANRECRCVVCGSKKLSCFCCSSTKLNYKDGEKTMIWKR